MCIYFKTRQMSKIFEVFKNKNYIITRERGGQIRCKNQEIEQLIIIFMDIYTQGRDNLLGCLNSTVAFWD